MFKKIISSIALAFLCSCSFGQNKNIAATRAYCDHNRAIAAQDAVTQLKPVLEDYIVDEVDRVSRSFVTNAYPVPIPITNTIYKTIDNVISNRVIYETTNVLVYSQYSFITNEYYSVNNITNFAVNVVTNVNATIERTTNFVYTATNIVNFYPGPFNAITSQTANIESLHVTKDLTFGSDSTTSMGSINIDGNVSIDGHINNVIGINADSIGTEDLLVYNDATFNNDIDVFGNITLDNGDINSVSNMSVKNKITIGTRLNDRTVIERGNISSYNITASEINGQDDYIDINADASLNYNVYIEGDVWGNSEGSRQYMYLNNASMTLWALTLDNLFVNNLLTFKGGSFNSSNIIVRSIHNDKPYQDIKNNVIDVNSKLNLNSDLIINNAALFNNGATITDGGLSIRGSLIANDTTYITNISSDVNITKSLTVNGKVEGSDAKFFNIESGDIDVNGTLKAANLDITNSVRFRNLTVATPFIVDGATQPINQRDIQFRDSDITFFRSPINFIGTESETIDVSLNGSTTIHIATNHIDIQGADINLTSDNINRGGKIKSRELETIHFKSDTIKSDTSIYTTTLSSTNVIASRITSPGNKFIIDSDGSIAMNFDGGLDDIVIDNDGIEVKGNRDIVNVSPTTASSGGKIVTDHIETVNNGAVNILKGTTSADDLNVSGGVSIGNGMSVEGNINAIGNVEATGIVKCKALQADDLITTNVLYADFLNIKTLRSATNYVGNHTLIKDIDTVDNNNQPITKGFIETDLIRVEQLEADNVIMQDELDLKKLNAASLQITNTTKGIMYQHTYDSQTQTYTNINVVAEQGLKNGLTIDAPVFLTGTASTGSAYLKPFWVYVEGESEPIPMIIRFKRKSTDSNSTDNGILVPTFYDATQYNVQPDGSLKHAWYSTYPYNHLIGEDYE